MPQFFDQPEQPTYGDYIDLFQSGMYGIAAGAEGLNRRYLSPEGGKEWQDYFNQKRDANTKEMTPAGRAQLEAEMGSAEFWRSPLGWATMQTVGASPYILASIAPMAFTGGGYAGLAAAAAAGGALTSGDVTNSIYNAIDSVDSDTLARKSPAYAKDILAGKTEQEARENLANLAIGNKPAWAFLAGAAANSIGVTGTAVRAASRFAGRAIPQVTGGFLKTALKEGGLGAVGGGAQTGTVSALTQQGAVDAGLQDKVDYAAAGQAALTGAVLGGGMGAMIGAIGGFGRGKRKSAAEPAKPSTETDPEIEEKTRQYPPGGYEMPRREPPPGGYDMPRRQPPPGGYDEETVNPQVGLGLGRAQEEPIITPSPMRGRTPRNPDALSPEEIRQRNPNMSFEEATRLAEQTGWRAPVEQTRRTPGGKFVSPSAIPTTTGTVQFRPDGGQAPEAAAPQFKDLGGRGQGPIQFTDTSGIPQVQTKVIMPDPLSPDPAQAVALSGTPIESRNYAGGRAPYGYPEEPRDVQFEDIPGAPAQITPPGTPRNLPSEQMAALKQRLQQPRPRGPPAVAGEAPPPAGPTSGPMPGRERPAGLLEPPQGQLAAPPPGPMALADQTQAIPTQGRIGGPPPTPRGLPTPSIPLPGATPNVPAVRPVPVRTPAAGLGGLAADAQARRTVTPEKAAAVLEATRRAANKPRTERAAAPAAPKAEPIEGVFEEVPEPEAEPKKKERKPKTFKLKDTDLSEASQGALFRAGMVEQKREALREHEERKLFEPKGKHWDKEEAKQIATSQKWAAKALYEYAPKELKQEDPKALRKRLSDTLKYFHDAGGKIKQAYEQTADELVYMAEVQDLHRKFMKGKAEASDINDFLMNEHSMVAEEDAGPMRVKRKIEGEQKSRGEQKPVEELPVAHGDAEAIRAEVAKLMEETGLTRDELQKAAIAEHMAEETTYSAGAVAKRGGEERGLPAKPTKIPRAGPVEKIELTPEELARYEGLKFRVSGVGKAEKLKLVKEAAVKKTTPKKLAEAKLKVQARKLSIARELGNKANYKGTPRNSNPFKRTGQEEQFNAWNEGWDIAAAATKEGRIAAEKVRIAAEERLRAESLAKDQADLAAALAERAAEKAAKAAKKLPPKVAKVVEKTKAKKPSAMDEFKATAKPAPKAEALKAKVKAKKEPKELPVAPAEDLLNRPDIEVFINSDADGESFVNALEMYRIFDTDTLKGYMKEAREDASSGRTPLELKALEQALSEKGVKVSPHSPAEGEDIFPAGWTSVDAGLTRPVRREQIHEVKEYLRANNIETRPFSELRGFTTRFLEHYLKGTDHILIQRMQAVLPSMLSRLNRYIEDVPVAWVTAKQMNELMGYEPIYDGITGEEIARTAAFYNPTQHILVFKNDIANKPDLPRLVVHEAVHAAFQNASLRNPEIRAAVTLIAKEFRAALGTGEFYAFRNVDEFIAEAFSNPTMQNRLMRTMASSELAQSLKTRRGMPTTALRTLWDAMRGLVAKAMGWEKPSASIDSLLDAMMHVGEELEVTLEGKKASGLSMAENIDARHQTFTESFAADNPWTMTGTSLNFPFEAGNYKKFHDYMPENMRPVDRTKQRKMWFLGTRSSDEIAQALKGFGGPKLAAAARVAVNLKERMRIRAQEFMRETDPFQLKLYELEKAYRGPVWDEVTSLIDDMTTARIDPSIPLAANKHISKEGHSDTWARAQYPELVKRWNKLSPELKAFIKNSERQFKHQQNSMQLGILRNYVMVAKGIEDEALVQKLFKGEKLTPDELKSVGGKSFLAAVKRARLTSLKGPYFPKMRFGEFVVDGFYKFDAPEGATVIKRDGEREGQANTFEFEGADARDKAMAYAAKQTVPTKVERAWVDPDTGEKYFTEIDDVGEETQVRADAKTEGAEERFRVTVQNKYLKMHETMKAAQADHFNLMADPTFVSTDLGPRRFNMADHGLAGREMMSHEISDLLDHLEGQAGYRAMTDMQKTEMKQLFRVMSINLVGSTRIQNRQRPRRNVLGASHDIHKTWVQYFQAASGFRAKLEIQPHINTSIKEMRGLVADPTDSTPYDQAARGMAVNELVKRITSPGMLTPPSNLNKWVNRATTVSFMNYLASPSYSLNGLLQVPMISFPSLAAAHNPVSAFTALGRAYAKIDVPKIMSAAVSETIKAGKALGPNQFLHPSERANFIDIVKKQLTPAEARMVQHLVDNGSIAPDAGLEIDQFLGNSNLDKAIDKLTNMARAAPIAVETINRVATGLAAFELMMKKTGGNEAKSILHAQEQVNITQGNYSSTNMPPIFSRHPLSNIFFQFKKYGQVVYNIMGHNLGKAIRNSSPGDRAEGVWALTYLLGSHAMMAGTLGLPFWEPIRIAVSAANQVGLTELKFEDVEAAERDLAAYMLGQGGGELVSRGLPRALGIDISGRVGASNLFTFGEPRDTDDYALQAYLGDLVGGAVGGTTMEMLTGVGDMLHGDVMKGMQKVAPIKAIADGIDAYRMATEGKETTAGYRIYDPTGFFSVDAIGKLLGYTSAKHAETSEQRKHFYSVQARETEQRDKLMQDWFKASGSEKPKVYGRINAYNQGKLKDEQVLMSDLNNYSKRRHSEDIRGGVKLTRRNRNLWQNMQDTYATEGYFGE